MLRRQKLLLKMKNSSVQFGNTVKVTEMGLVEYISNVMLFNVKILDKECY